MSVKLIGRIAGNGDEKGNVGRIIIRVLTEEDPNKKGNPCYFVMKGNNNDDPWIELPGRLFYNGEPGEGVFTVSTPVIKTDADGNPVFIPAQNRDGEYIDKRDRVVDSPEKAKQVVEYLRARGTDDPVYGTRAVIGVKNNKINGSPTKSTILNTKVFTEEEMLEVERALHRLRRAKEAGKDVEQYEDALRNVQRESGEWLSAFPQDAGIADFIESKGFEVRLSESRRSRDRSQQSAPAASVKEPETASAAPAPQADDFDFDDDIPF